MGRFYKIALVVLVLVAFTGVDANAQCAMCRRIVESNLNDSSAAVAKSLNGAILYLMCIPYIILASLLWLFYKNIKAKQSDDDAAYGVK